MAKVLSASELAELSRLGTVKYDPEDLNIARFGELIEKLDQLINAQASRTQADLSRSQAQLEVLAALQKQINGKGTKSPQTHVTIDLSPLNDVLAQIKEASLDRVRTAYKFDIHRGEGGFMHGVTATPIEPTRH